jgi:type IV pilus assembly protein PilO
MNVGSLLKWGTAFDDFVDKAQKVKKGHRALIFAAIFFLFGASFLWFVYLPKTGEIARIEDESLKLREQLQRERINIKKLPKLEEEYGAIEERFQKASSLLPDEKEIPALLTELSNLGIDSKLEFLLFSPQTEAVKGPYSEINVSLVLKGSYQNIVLFFHKVRCMKRIVAIVDISMKPVVAPGTSKEMLVSVPVLTTTCSAKTYRFTGKVPKPEKKWWEILSRVQDK